MDVSSAAKNYLASRMNFENADSGNQKIALKDFSYAEQQALINEGSGGKVTARNLDGLRIDGTHYSAIETAMQAGEIDPDDLFI